jgi:hypothetical protein
VAIDSIPLRVLALCALAALPLGQDAAPAPAQDASAPLAQSTFSAEELEQIAGRVALYPDELLAQMLMASTYPVEVAQAARWMEESPGLQGDALDAALRSQDWDDSVKVLCHMPSVLALLSGNLDWTQDLGDAFLGQKEELFAQIQSLRAQAQSAGTLASSDQQKVSQDGEAILIEPVSDELLWVPSYTPEQAYGSDWKSSSWPYSDWYQPWDDSWSGDWVGGWGDCDWHDDDVKVKQDEHESFADKVRDYLENAPKPEPQDAAPLADRSTWQHDPEHRKGVNYRNPDVAQRFGDRVPANGVTRDEARGRGNPPGRPATTPGGLLPWNVPDPRPGGSPAPRPRPGQQPHRSGNALGGARSPALDRAGSKRGAKSRGGGGRAPRAPRPPRPSRGGRR